MKHKLFDIEMAFEYVSSQPPLTNYAILCRDSGRIYYSSDVGDEDEECPEDLADNHVEIPHRNDFDLGTSLVWRFVREQAPDLKDEVSAIFSRKGAYSRFKSLLREIGRLEAWHDFENSASSTAIRRWCEENHIELEDPAGREPA